MRLKTKVFTTEVSACELSAFTAYKSKIFLHKIHVTCICILKKRTYLKLFSRTAHKLKCLHSWINGINDYLFHIVEFITLDNNHPPHTHTRLHIIIFILRPDTLFIYFPTCYTWSKTGLLFKSKMYTCKSKRKQVAQILDDIYLSYAGRQLSNNVLFKEVVSRAVNRIRFTRQ